MVTDAEKLALLIRAGQRARAAQKCYFRDRTPTALEDARAAEREFDRVLDAVATPADVKQPTLF